MSAEPFAVAPADGLSVENPAGGIITFKATAATTGGSLTAIDTTVAPGEGPPLHVHRDQDETIYTLEGQFLVKLGETVIDAPPESFVFIPRGTPHCWQNSGGVQGRFVATLAPADTRFEEFFMRYAELPPAERGAEAFARVARETHAMEVVGPPLAASFAR